MRSGSRGGSRPWWILDGSLEHDPSSGRWNDTVRYSWASGLVQVGLTGYKTGEILVRRAVEKPVRWDHRSISGLGYDGFTSVDGKCPPLFFDIFWACLEGNFYILAQPSRKSPRLPPSKDPAHQICYPLLRYARISLECTRSLPLNYDLWHYRFHIESPATRTDIWGARQLAHFAQSVKAPIRLTKFAANRNVHLSLVPQLLT